MESDSLEIMLEQHDKRKEEEAARMEEEKHRLIALVQKAQKEEQISLGRILSYAESIFVWAKAFSQTDTFKRLLEVINFWPPSKFAAIYVNGGGWAHEATYDERGVCSWSRLYLRQDGTLYYCAGYRQHSCGPEFTIQTPKELAAKLCVGYIVRFTAKIETGKVYDTIIKFHLRKWGPPRRLEDCDY